MTAVCKSLFQGFLQETGHSEVGEYRKDHCHQNKNVLLCEWKLWLQEHFHRNLLEQGNKKFL